MALTDVSDLAEEDARFRSSHAEDMAELDWVVRYLSDDFERAYRRLRSQDSDCNIVTLAEDHHYLIVPKRPGQLLGRVLRYVPEQDVEPVPLNVVVQQITDSRPHSDARPADVLPFKGPALGTTERSLLNYGKQTKNSEAWTFRRWQGERYKWFHPFGS